MKTELKRKWVNALRSGDYPQGYGTLRGPLGFCALGVLLDVSGIGDWTYDEQDRYTGNYYAGGCLTDGELCGVREFVGLSDDLETLILQINDEDRADFNYLADFIEAAIVPEDLPALRKTEPEEATA